MSEHTYAQESGIADGAVAGLRGVKRTAAGYAQSGAGEVVDAIAYHDAADGAVFSIIRESRVRALSGAAVAEAEELMADALGKFIPYVAGAGNILAGYAETAATGADQEFDMRHNSSRMRY